MTTGFIEATRHGVRTLIAIDHIVAIIPFRDMTRIYTSIGDQSSDAHRYDIDQSYDVVKSMLTDYINNQRKNMFGAFRKELINEQKQ